MNRWRLLLKVSLLLTFAFSIMRPLSAQQITGEISGVVTDKSGAIIPDATITITNDDTKAVVRTLHSNHRGEYVAPLLQVGSYTLTASAAGFATTTIQSIQVDVTAQVKEDFKLAAGSEASVTVNDANNLAPDLESGALGTTITGSEIKDLALNTRNFEQIVQLEPGVTFGGSSDQLYTGLVSPSGSRNSAALSINGLRQDQNANLLDGMDNLEHNSGTSAIIFPVIEAIDQIKVLRNSYNAQYGGGGNAQITVVTKSGGSVYHGDVHFLVRNSIFNANNYFNNLVGKPRPQDNQYTAGFTVGGPIFIPHILSKEKANAFFFYALEIKRDQVQTVNNITNIPQTSWIGNPQGGVTGVFDENVCQAYTPGTHTCTGAKLTAGTPLPLANYNPVSLEYIQDVFSKFPAPNNPIDANGIIIDAPNGHEENEQFVRIDRAFGSRLNTFFRFVYDPVSITSNNALYANSYQQFAPLGIPGISNTAAQTNAYAFLLHGTYALTNATVVDLSLSYSPYSIQAQPTGAFSSLLSPDVHVNLPFATPDTRLPTITISPATYGGAGPKHDENHTYQISANVFHTIGRHSISFGVNFEEYKEDVNQGTISSGQFKFQTAGDFEQTFVDFLVGAPQQFVQSSVDPESDSKINMLEGYVQDDWKVLPRLTLNGGVRYSFFEQPTEANNHIGSFAPSFYNPLHAPTINYIPTPVGGTPNPLDGTICLAPQTSCLGGGAPNPNYDPLNGILQGGINSPYGKAVSNQPTMNLAPRVGFAMDVYGDGKTALKGGFGYFFDQTQLNVVHNVVYNNPAYVQVETIADPNFANPGSAVSATNPAPLPAYGVASHWKTPYTMGYSLEVQQQFSNEQILDIAYSGNISKHLPGQIDINQPYGGEYLQTGLPYPGGTGANPAINLQALNAIRPFLGYEVIVSENPVFYGDYNALQASYNRRIGGSSRLSLNYTWSKALSDSLGATTQDGQPSGAPQNSYCLPCEYGPVNFDRRHVFTTHYVYHVPYYARAQHGFYQHLVGGFELAGIVTAAAGLQLTPKVANLDTAGVGITSINSPETGRPNQISDPNNNAPHTRLSWIGNAASAAAGIAPIAYAIPPQALGIPGNAKVGSIRGPGYVVFNLSVFKNETIKDAQTLQIRVQAFNALNHTNWAGIGLQSPGAGFNNNFGQVTSARDPREMEFGLKYVF